MSVILLKRCEKLPGESDLGFAIRVLNGFLKGAEASAEAASAELHGAVIEAHKRGKADGLREALHLISAVAQECAIREHEQMAAGSIEAIPANN